MRAWVIGVPPIPVNEVQGQSEHPFRKLDVYKQIRALTVKRMDFPMIIP
jgi:hypothetical protein